METEHPLFSCPRGCGDVGDIAQPTPWWWRVTWLVWGLVVGTAILVLDRDWLTAGLWFVAGLLWGQMGFNVLRPLGAPIMQWYQHWAGDSERLRFYDSFSDVDLENREEFDCRLEEYYQSEEHKWYLQRQQYAMTLFAPVITGSFFGVLFLTPTMALCSLDSETGFCASEGAILGLIGGPVVLAFTISSAMPLLVKLDFVQSLPGRLLRRALLVVSPVLIFPALCFCLSRLIAQRRLSYRR